MRNFIAFCLRKIATAKRIVLPILFSFLTLTLTGVLMCSSLQGALYPLSWISPPPLIPRFRPGEILIRFKGGTPSYRIANVIQRYGLQPLSASPFSGIQRVSAGATIQGDLLQVLRWEQDIAFIEANFFRRAEDFIPNDPLLVYQWHLNINHLPLAWELSTGQGVIMAVLDSGVAYENYLQFAPAPDLANTSFVPGWDFVNNDANPDDDNRHGTHIAGIIAQSTNNLIGGAGVAFQCSLMPVKVLDATGSGDVATIVDGIYYAVNNGAQIINMSFGSVGDPSATEEEAIQYAVDHGVLVICSAGNEATNQPHYPSSYPSSISVTATRFDNQFVAAYSNFGPDVDLAAPGGDLSLDQDGDGSPDGIYQQTHNGKNFRVFDFYYAEGTSSACAYASGVAALVLARGGGQLSPAQTRDILQSTALDMGTPGWDEQYGWGVVDPYAAVLAVDALLAPAVAASQGILFPFSLVPISQPTLLGGLQLAYSGLGLTNPLTYLSSLSGLVSSSPLSPVIMASLSGYNSNITTGITQSLLRSAAGTSDFLPLLTQGLANIPLRSSLSSYPYLSSTLERSAASRYATGIPSLLEANSAQAGYYGFFNTPQVAPYLFPWLW